MSDKADGSELIKDKNFQNLLDKMDKDADAAEKQWKTQLANSIFVDFPPKFLQDYKNDGATMIKSRGAFNAEWNKVVLGKGDAKKLMAAYDSYSGWLEALYESNTRFQAIITINLGPKVEAILKLIQAFGNLCTKRLADLEKKLEELEAEIEEADREFSKGELKAYLNAMLSAITLLAAPESSLVRLGMTGIAIAAHSIFEFALGQGTAKGTAVAIGGDAPDLIHKFTEAQAKFAGAAGAFLAAKFDADEVGEAFDKLQELRPKVQEAKSAVDQVAASLNANIPYLQKVDATLNAIRDQISRAMNAKVSATKNYDAIKNAIKKTM